MEKFYSLIRAQIGIWVIIFTFAIFFGVLYSAQLLGFSAINETLLHPAITRSLHITLMLYGPVMLALSLLPFALFAKDGINLDGAVVPMKNYFTLWHLFLLMATITIMQGNMRGLPFYDFAYWLNFILAFSGVFYIIAIFKTIKNYSIEPIWVKVSKAVLFAAPISLVVLMNPSFGQVEKSLIGPHGDNTLGMSFTLIPLFYLLIKLHAKEHFKPRWHIFWIIPLAGYAASVLTRSFSHNLSYNEEWVYQWLTFTYAPLLLVWVKDAKISLNTAPYLLISIWAFLFVMVQGNILFIPEIRWPFHRNDLVVAHAHAAIAVGIFFMALSTLKRFYTPPKSFLGFWLFVMALVFIPLTIAGFGEAGFADVDIEATWYLRLLGGVVAVGGLTFYGAKILSREKYSNVQLYNLLGFASDALGGVVLFVAAPPLFALLGFKFSPHYYLVFGFMTFVGLLHLRGVWHDSHTMAKLTSSARLITGTIFLSLYGTLDELALLVGVYDISYALLYALLLVHQDERVRLDGGDTKDNL